MDNTSWEDTKILTVPPYHDLKFTWETIDGDSHGCGEVLFTLRVAFYISFVAPLFSSRIIT